MKNYHGLLQSHHLFSVNGSDAAGVTFQGILQSATWLQTQKVDKWSENERQNRKQNTTGDSFAWKCNLISWLQIACVKINMFMDLFKHEEKHLKCEKK